MKQTVKLSTYSFIMTILTLIALIGVFVWEYYKTGSEAVLWIFLGIMMLWAFCVLFYGPLSIELTGSTLNINRSLRIKEIPLADIQVVKLCPPTLAAKRIFGSGGCFGYWGWFSERDLGKYFAYYGKSSDCFLIELIDGKKYILGCENAPAMVDALKARINHG